ncbi:MAG: SufE family protein [Chlamydiia bacterium]|jgi:cysteine desulfuration protein SufE
MSNHTDNHTYSPLTPSQEIVTSLFARMTDAQEKYKRIIELGMQSTSLPSCHHTESNLVSGCQSIVYLHASEAENGTIHFEAYSEALISAGLAWIATQFYSGLTPEQVIKMPPVFINKLELQNSLSLGRSNGLTSMVDLIKKKSLEFYMRALQNKRAD